MIPGCSETCRKRRSGYHLFLQWSWETLTSVWRMQNSQQEIQKRSHQNHAAQPDIFKERRHWRGHQISVYWPERHNIFDWCWHVLPPVDVAAYLCQHHQKQTDLLPDRVQPIQSRVYQRPKFDVSVSIHRFAQQFTPKYSREWVHKVRGSKAAGSSDSQQR